MNETVQTDSTDAEKLEARGPRPAAEGRPSALRRVFRQVEHVLAVVGLIMILYPAGFELSVVTSSSMSPTLQGIGTGTGDWVLTEKILYRFRSPRRWEVISFHDREGVSITKRLVGFPGETISIKDQWVAINGDPLPRPPPLGEQRYYGYGNLLGHHAFKIDKGYYVLGDDSKDSADSRYEGLVLPNTIHGRAWLIVWPPERIGFVR